jgi:hypothetical protein
MTASSETKYILVGTYKTNDEKFGWYINDKRYAMLWEKLNEKFRAVDHKKNSFDGTYGNIEGVSNFHFYDLVKYDNEILTTKDKEVFKIPEKRMECIERLRTLINIIEENPNQEYRIGLQGNNSVGLFLNFLEDLDRLKSLSLSTISKDHRHKKFGEILINNPNLQNLKVFKIFNLTQPAPSHKDLASIFHESWNEFLEINTYNKF